MPLFSGLAERLAPFATASSRFWGRLDASDDDGALSILQSAECGMEEAKGAELEEQQRIYRERQSSWDPSRDAVDFLSPDKMGFCPVHICAAKGLIRTLDALARRGVDINQPGPEGNTPLHLSAFHGQAACAARLIELGASTSTLNAHHKRPVDVAFGGAVRDALCPLHVAAKSGDVTAVTDLLSNGVPVDSPGSSGSTALQVAVHCARRDVVALLLAAGADPLKRNTMGSTPMDLCHDDDIREMLATMAERRRGRMLVARGRDGVSGGGSGGGSGSGSGSGGGLEQEARGMAAGGVGVERGVYGPLAPLPPEQVSV